MTTQDTIFPIRLDGSSLTTRLSETRAMLWATMDAQMQQARVLGTIADSAASAYVYELAATVLQLGKLMDLIETRDGQ